MVFLAVDPRRLFRLVIVTVVLLNAMSLGLRLAALAAGVGASMDNQPDFAGFVGLLNVDAESNIPTWASAALLLMSALALWGVSVSARAAGDPWQRHWAVLALAACYLSVDESVSLHERAGNFVAMVIDDRLLVFGWVLLGGPLVAVFGFTYLRFLRALPRGTRHLMVLAGVLYVGGALGMEIVGWSVHYSGGVPGSSMPYLFITAPRSCWRWSAWRSSCTR